MADTDKHTPTSLPELKMLKRQWRKYPDEKKIEILKRFDVILTDYKVPWRAGKMSPPTFRERAVKFAFAINFKNFDKGMKLFNQAMSNFDKGMGEFSSAFGSNPKKKMWDEKKLPPMWSASKTSKDVTNKIRGKKKPKLTKSKPITKNNTSEDVTKSIFGSKKK